MKKFTSTLLALALLAGLASNLGTQARAEQIYNGVNGESLPVISLIPETDPETQPYVPPVETVPQNPQVGWNPETQPIIWDPPTETTTNNLVPVITKDPYGETVQEGEYAEFIARADNCSGIIWHLVSPTGGSDVLCSDAPNTFNGLRVEGLNTERLMLRNIPKALDGWKVRAEFVGWEKNVMSADAVIHVTAVELKTPIITENPMSVNLQSNQGTVLRANAYVEGGATLTYQWYQSSFNSNSGGMAIAGATSSTYTPDYANGTMYYYCVIRATSGNQFSEAVKTSCAAVTYVPAATQPTQPSTVPTMAPAPTTAPTVAPTEAATEYQRPTGETISWTTPTTEPERMPQTTVKTGGSSSLLMIIVAIILLIAVIGIIATVLILKFYPNGDDDDEEYEKPLPRKPADRAAYEEAKRNYEAALRRQAAMKQAQRTAQQPRPAAPKQQTTAHKYERPVESAKEPVIDWDDLSDLGDLSVYFEDEEK